MKGLIGLAKKHPEKVWGAFQRWYCRSTRDDMPSWTIERFEGEEVHIHLFDFATHAIENSLRKYCGRKKLDFSEEIIDDYLPARHLCISKGGKPLLRLHNTSCSTESDSYICVHLQADDAALKTLLDLFRYHITSEDVAFYRKIYKEAHHALRKRPPAALKKMVGTTRYL